MDRKKKHPRASQATPLRSWAGGTIFIVVGLAISFIRTYLNYFINELVIDADPSVAIFAAILFGVSVGTAVMVIVHFGKILVRLGMNLRGRDARKVISGDLRPPILYLRPFGFDKSSFNERNPGLEWALSIALGKVAPLVAIGQPGDRLQPVGAARTYVGDDWQDVVTDLMHRAVLIIFLPGISEGLMRELAIATATLDPTKILFIVSISSAWGGPRIDYPGFREQANRVLPLPLPESVGAAQLIVFGPNWEPGLIEARLQSGALNALNPKLRDLRLLNRALSQVHGKIGMRDPKLPIIYEHTERLLFLLILFLWPWGWRPHFLSGWFSNLPDIFTMFFIIFLILNKNSYRTER